MCHRSAEDEELGEEGDLATIDKVRLVIRRLTGAEVGPLSPFDAVGLDSFGISGLLGVLRSTFPHAKKLRAGEFFDLQNVAGLVRRLDELELADQGSQGNQKGQRVPLLQAVSDVSGA